MTLDAEVVEFCALTTVMVEFNDRSHGFTGQCVCGCVCVGVCACACVCVCVITFSVNVINRYIDNVNTG